MVARASPAPACPERLGPVPGGTRISAPRFTPPRRPRRTHRGDRVLLLWLPRVLRNRAVSFALARRRARIRRDPPRAGTLERSLGALREALLRARDAGTGRAPALACLRQRSLREPATPRREGYARLGGAQRHRAGEVRAGLCVAGGGRKGRA